MPLRLVVKVGGSLLELPDLAIRLRRWQRRLPMPLIPTFSPHAFAPGRRRNPPRRL